LGAESIQQEGNYGENLIKGLIYLDFDDHFIRWFPTQWVPKNCGGGMGT